MTAYYICFIAMFVTVGYGLGLAWHEMSVKKSPSPRRNQEEGRSTRRG